MVARIKLIWGRLGVRFKCSDDDMHLDQLGDNMITYCQMSELSLDRHCQELFYHDYMAILSSPST